MIFGKKDNVLKNWKQFIDVLDKKIPKFRTFFNSGISESEILKSLIHTKMQLPNEIRIILNENNGENELSICGGALGLKFNSLEKIISDWESWNEIYVQFKNKDDNTSSRYESVPPNCIKKMYINPSWIPIISDSSGNHIGIDLDPDINGKIGQIITFGRDEDKKFVLSNSLSDFLKRIIRVLNDKSCKIEEYEGYKIIVPNGHYHAIDYFKSPDAIS